MLEIYTLILLFLTGLTIGIILVSLGLHLPKQEGLILSNCNNCKQEYRIREIIPLISYFQSRGKCNYCHVKLKMSTSIYPIISAVLFSLSYLKYGFSYEMLVFILISCLFVITYVTDFNYYILLDSPTLILSVSILILKLLTFGFKTFIISIVSGLLIFIFMLILKITGDKIYKTESLGGGDIKLSFLFGATLGLRLGITSLILGSILAFPYAIYNSLQQKDSLVPFGPFLVTAFLLIFFFMDPIRNFMLLIFS